MMAAVSLPSLKATLPQGLNERIEQIMAKEKKKTVSWPAEDKLCQVCLFAAEDAPSISGGMASQDLYQAKQTRFMHTAIPVSDSDDDLPPGFESMVSRMARLDSEAVQAMLPLPRWSCPPKIVHDPRWQVATGSENTEAEAQVQREVRVLEAVYPRLSAIPLSPSEPLEGANTDIEGSLERELPLAPIEDELETEEEGIFFATADAKPGVSRNGFDNKVGFPLLRAPNPQVPIAAAAAAYAALKSYERGQMIDNGLISKIFNSPDLVDTLLLSIKNPNESNNRVAINGAPALVPGQIHDFVSNSFRSIRVGGEIIPPVMSTSMYNRPRMDYFKGYMRGTTDAHLGPIRGQIDANLGSISGTSESHLGSIRGMTDTHLGPIRGPTDAHLGPMRGLADAHLGPLRAPIDAHLRGPTDAHLGPMRGPTDAHLGPIRGLTDAHFGPVRGSTDAHFGPIRGPSDTHSVSFPISIPISVPPPSMQQLASGRPLAMGMMGHHLSGERQRVMAPGPSPSSGRPLESFQPEQFRSSAGPPRICFYYNTARGCRNGSSCPFLHDPDRKRDHERMAPDFFPPLASMKRPRFNPASAFAVVMTNLPTDQGSEKPETEKTNQQPERRVVMEAVGDVENH